MKRYGNLFEKLISFENLLLASKKAQKGKRFKDSTGNFNLELEKELLLIQHELRQGLYKPGTYKRFLIFEPKKRLISAAPYRDRIIQHALCNIIEPIFDNAFIYDTYSCRKGKGTHAAVERFSAFCRKARYVLKCDISSYFDSIDHKVLFDLISRKIKDRKVLWLIRIIISSLNRAEGKGIPIGNLASQFFANIYLDGMDHFIKEKLKCRYYIRYTDDFVVLDDNKEKLHGVKKKIEEYLLGLRLNMHPDKCAIFKVEQGTDFLGYKIFPGHRLVRKSNIKRFTRRIKKYRKELLYDKISLAKITRSIESWAAHAAHANSFGFLKKLGIGQNTRQFLEQYSRQPARC
ncbi:group II intron reverse transcriptase domain-containing protein [Candidatus Saganbacteria bacterium]|nr:group II intron reverse transcriptase domain-containing protein [Candidatus Saganbacteria bacterium]